MSEHETYDLFQQGKAHLKNGRAAQATVAFEKAKQREPHKASIREALGIAYFRIHRWEEAESEFRAMLELAPTDDYAHYALGRCLEKQGKAHEANGHYKLANSLRPGKADYESRIKDLDPSPDQPSDTLSRGSDLGSMRAVVQRVSRARSTPGGEIGPGLLILLGVGAGDTEAEVERLAGKIARLRIFEGDSGKLDRSLLDTGGAALVVSQFTLITDSRRQKGTRPDFSKAARPEVAEPLFERFCQALRDLGVAVQTGVFGARMDVESVNHGPVTIVLDT